MKNAKTLAELHQGLERLVYEIEQLATLQHVPVRLAPGRLMQNAVTEKRLLHVRNLLTFLMGGPTCARDDDFRVSDLGLDESTWPNELRSVVDRQGEVLSQIHKRMAHITTVAQPDAFWPRSSLDVPILQRCVTLLDRLAQLQPWSSDRALVSRLTFLESMCLQAIGASEARFSALPPISEAAEVTDSCGVMPQVGYEGRVAFGIPEHVGTDEAHVRTRTKKRRRFMTQGEMEQLAKAIAAELEEKLPGRTEDGELSVEYVNRVNHVSALSIAAGVFLGLVAFSFFAGVAYVLIVQ